VGSELLADSAGLLEHLTNLLGDLACKHTQKPQVLDAWTEQTLVLLQGQMRCCGCSGGGMYTDTGWWGVHGISMSTALAVQSRRQPGQQRGH
jgi:hypothetical protein